MKKSFIAIFVGIAMVTIGIVGLLNYCCKLAASFLSINYMRHAMKLIISIMTIEKLWILWLIAIAGFIITLIGIYYYHDRKEW